MIPLQIRLKNFLDSVSIVADERRQRSMWVERRLPDGSFMISLGELYAQFFDDNDIDNFIADELDVAPLDPKQRSAIRSFRDALNSFSKAPGKSESFETDAELIEDAEWKQLTMLAKTTLDAFTNAGL
ncbi:MAG: hypothetical protein KKC79_11490 [Gammaproteobacteria bacterium]|nr:hypothetical protein [Gammaproteobacteria bacterium]MBU1442394.1 hypothetical protein [Gammaproteobacteria bacterium]MBU2284825.1 hypothetical protein [Gammaproteobacteria bacterium]MBU2409252.1 hypothetical protein [Gammaproteobacteria bacterium]